MTISNVKCDGKYLIVYFYKNSEFCVHIQYSIKNFEILNSITNETVVICSKNNSQHVEISHFKDDMYFHGHMKEIISTTETNKAHKDDNNFIQYSNSFVFICQKCNKNVFCFVNNNIVLFFDKIGEYWNKHKCNINKNDVKKVNSNREHYNVVSQKNDWTFLTIQRTFVKNEKLYIEFDEDSHSIIELKTTHYKFFEKKSHFFSMIKKNNSNIKISKYMSNRKVDGRLIPRTIFSSIVSKKTCQYCKKKFNTGGELKIHIFKEHSNLKNKTTKKK